MGLGSPSKPASQFSCMAASGHKRHGHQAGPPGLCLHEFRHHHLPLLFEAERSGNRHTDATAFRQADGLPGIPRQKLRKHVFDVLPILKKYNVGAISWGLVNGKCHFHYPWGHKVGDPEPEIWFHDIFRPDHTPYDPAEITFLQEMTK